MEKNKIREYVLQWNEEHPIDLWWRKKHGVAFMSESHKSITFLQQMFEFEEDKLYNEMLEEELKSKGLIEEEDNRPVEEQMKDMQEEFEQYLKEKGE